MSKFIQRQIAPIIKAQQTKCNMLYLRRVRFANKNNLRQQW